MDIPYEWITYFPEFNTKVYTDGVVTLDKLDQKSFLFYIFWKTGTMGETSFDLNLDEEKVKSDLEKYKLSDDIDHDVERVVGAMIYVPEKDVNNYIATKYNYENYNIRNFKNTFGDIIDANEPIVFDSGNAGVTLYDGNFYIYMVGTGKDAYKTTLNYTYKKVGDLLYIYEEIVIVDFDEYYNLGTDGNELSCYQSQIDEIGINKVTPLAKDYGDIRDSNKIKNICGKYSKIYKHTFKKNSNGNYYWYSTEPYIEN